LHHVGITAAYERESHRSPVQGIISDEDFAKMKVSIQIDLEQIQEGLRALDSEHAATEELIENTNDNLQNLSFRWQTVGLQDRIELQCSLRPAGFRWTPSNHFLNTSNHSRYQQAEEMMRDLSVHGGPSRAFTEPANSIIAFIKRFGTRVQ
jgi:hypothetical protein